MENSKLHYIQIINAKIAGFILACFIASMALNIAQWEGLLVNKNNLTVMIPKDSISPVYSQLEDEALINSVTNRTR